MFAGRSPATLIPLFTGEVFFVATGLHQADSGNDGASLAIMRVW